MQRAGLVECKAVWDLMISKHGLCTIHPDICHRVGCKNCTGPHMPRNIAMSLKDMVVHLLFERARQLLANHHAAGNDALMAVLLAHEFVRRANA